MGVRDITRKEFFTNEERFAELMNVVCFHGHEILKPEELITEPESVRKADETTVLERMYDVVKNRLLMKAENGEEAEQTILFLKEEIENLKKQLANWQ